MKRLIIILFFWAFPAFATISINPNSNAFTPAPFGGGILSHSFGTMASVATGSSMFCAAQAAGAAGLTTMTISDNVNAGNYTQLTTLQASTDVAWVALFAKYNVASGTYTFTETVDALSSNLDVTCVEVSGLGTSPTVDSTASINKYPTSCGTSNITSCATTPATNGDLVVGYILEYNSNMTSGSALSPWAAGNWYGSGTNKPDLEMMVQGTAAAISALATTQGNYWDAGIVAVKPGAAVALPGRAVIF